MESRVWGVEEGPRFRVCFGGMWIEVGEVECQGEGVGGGWGRWLGGLEVCGGGRGVEEFGFLKSGVWMVEG